ncbi:AraC family transcriptional regulator [Erwinia mallotivora]|uniref:AraC family transcriptional regulator n=2 Tax=Erwinia TaxID=551 RepID=A0A014NU24_9GAMM|nr:AraC family transcriptional regulator [Erwinia mallotivora]
MALLVPEELFEVKIEVMKAEKINTGLPDKSDWIARISPPNKPECIEAYFSGHGYDLHRHDTWAIGQTLAGVQSFHYRRTLVHSLPGRTMVLHPDELHDGHAGTEKGFRYRMVYIQPSLIQHVLQGLPLPFIAGGLSDHPGLFAASNALLNPGQSADPLETDDALFDLAHALAAASGVRRGRKSIDYRSAEQARIYLLDSLEHPVTLEELEQATGRERWSLSRDFRVLFGTSPYRYLTMRRLELARCLISSGIPLVHAAIRAGFVDQSHMTRHFKKTYGQTPWRWLQVQQHSPAEHRVNLHDRTRRW